MDTGPLNKCPGLWSNRKLSKHFKCLGGPPAVSPPSTGPASVSSLCLFAALLLTHGSGRGVVSRVRGTPRLTIFQAPKFSYSLCATQCAEEEKKRKWSPTKRKLNGLNVMKKIQANSYEHSPSHATARSRQQHQQQIAAEFY